MPDTQDTRPIPTDLRDAFQQAIGAFQNWNGGPELLVSYDRKEFTIDAVCVWVAAFHDPAPPIVYDTVKTLAAEFQSGPEHLNHDCSGPADHSYSSVALCLHRLYDARKDYNLRETRDRDPQ